MKRKYVKPAVESEEALEQTSLQCNISYFPMEEICEWGGNFCPGAQCTYDVSKGGVFFRDVDGCQYDINAGWACVVALS